MKKAVFISFFAVLFCQASYAQQAAVINQQVPAKVSFAQPFDVRFELSHTPGYTLELDKENLPDGFTLTNEQKQVLSESTSAYDLTFMPFTLGPSTFTAVTFRLQTPNGQPEATLVQTESVPIEIEPVRYFNDKKMRDIRPPYIPANWLAWLLTATAVLTAGFLFWYFKHRSRQAHAGTLPEQQDNRPAEVIALTKIEALLQSGLWEQAQYKLFYTELEDILRDYFWRRLRLDVSSDTSAELLHRARRTPALAPVLALLRNYLTSSDLVKFAKAAPDQQTMQQDVSAVRQIIESTTPQLVPAQKEER